jgi:hypothetical protein
MLWGIKHEKIIKNTFGKYIYPICIYISFPLTFPRSITVPSGETVLYFVSMFAVYFRACALYRFFYTFYVYKCIAMSDSLYRNLKNAEFIIRLFNEKLT